MSQNSLRRKGITSFHQVHLGKGMPTPFPQLKVVKDINTLNEVAENVNLKMIQFRRDLSDRRLLAELVEDHTFATETLDIFSTPTLVFSERQATFLKMAPSPSPEECLSVFTELRNLVEQRQNIKEVKRPQRPSA